MRLFDTHTHLNAKQFEGHVEEVIQAARKEDVAYMAVVGFDRPTIQRALEISAQDDGIIAAIGWHPTEAYCFDQKNQDYLYQMLQQANVYMLGEIGLDYYWEDSTKEEQDRAFRLQIQMAKDLNLPITIHNREATEAVYQVLKEEGLPAAGGIMHSFGGNVAEVEQFLDLGMYISFSGVVTFKKTDSVREAAKRVPANRLLIETDAPYLAPVPYRGKTNQPAYVKEVARVLAEVRGLSLEEIAEQTTRNAFDIFKWEPPHE